MVAQIAANAITLAGSCFCQSVASRWINGIVVPPRPLYHHDMLPINDRRFMTLSSRKTVPLLTKEKIRLLEAADCLNSIEKVRLLAILAGKRWLTEVSIRKDGSSHNISVTDLLDDLGLAWIDECYTKKDGTRVDWIEVGANAAVIEYITLNRHTLSVLEAGVLYGYPVTAVLAASGILNEKRKRVREKTTAQRCLGGIFSSDNEKDEERFLEEQWQALSRITKEIVSEATLHLG